jgi:hypothetical protein
MSAPTRTPRGRFAGARPALAAFLLLGGVLFGVFYRVADSSEHHSYNSGALSRFPVHLTLGRQYELSTPGGVEALKKRGISPAAVACTWTSDGSPEATLGIVSLADGRTTHAFATITGPRTGPVTIVCDGVPALFVDDADDVQGDAAGLFVVLATICLTLGVALLLSLLYQRRPRVRDPQADNGQ